jgi:hypothetical protein
VHHTHLLHHGADGALRDTVQLVDVRRGHVVW